MVSKTIKNPIGLLGAFASIAQITITCAINLVNEEKQNYFIYFAIGFPILLTMLFFITLLTKPSVLYSPSDYKSERNFLISIGLVKSPNVSVKRINRKTLKEK